MENDKDYQDLINEYQILLDEEKRRLNFVTEKNDKVVAEAAEYQQTDNDEELPEKDNDDKLPENDGKTEHEIVDDKESQVTDRHKRRMEKWVSDSFYTSFPSIRAQELNAQRLADDRRDDYRKYLAEVSNKKLLDNIGSSRRTQNNSHTEFSKPPELISKFTTRDKLLDDLKHSNLSYNFHNPDAIDDRNRKVAIERTRKKVELQQELIRQIEEKKLQIETLRAKEKEEEEILQRRLDNQMKALQMADEISKRNNEKLLMPKIADAVPKRHSDHNFHHHKSTDNLSESGLRNEVNDRQIYKFFSNSAPHNESYYYNQPVGFNSIPIVDPRFQHISTAIHQHCNRCRCSIPTVCNSCCHNDLNPTHFCCYHCNVMNGNNCRRAWAPNSWNHHGDMNFYQRDNRPQILEITYQDHSSQTNRSTSPQIIERSKSNGLDSPDRNANKFQNENHFTGSSEHSDKIAETDSILSDVPDAVSLSKEMELMELKRRNDNLIAKHARNYGSLRKRQTISKERKSSEFMDDSFPLPLMRVQLPTTGRVDVKRKNSEAVRNLEYKWEIPVVQKQVISNNPSKVLTQVGAIGKQLQLEKLHFGND